MDAVPVVYWELVMVTTIVPIYDDLPSLLLPPNSTVVVGPVMEPSGPASYFLSVTKVTSIEESEE